jgi:hypothetical protein
MAASTRPVLVCLALSAAGHGRALSGRSRPAAWPRFLVVFRAKLGPCRVEELRSALCTVLGEEVPLSALDLRPAHGAAGRLVDSGLDVGPPVFQWASFPSADVARAAARRCACVRALIDAWAFGKDDAACARMATRLPAERAQECVAPLVDGRSWAIHFHGYGIGTKGGSGLTLAQKQARIGLFRTLLKPIPGRVDLSSPAHSIWLLDDYEPPTSSPGGEFKAHGPRFVAIGYLLGTGAEREVQRSRLSARARLHMTSLPSDLSLLMCNLARVRVGHVILDPFVGTGSTLIAAALVGTMCSAPTDAAEAALGFAAAGRDAPDTAERARSLPPTDTAEASPGERPWPAAVRCIGTDVEEVQESVALNFEQLGLGVCVEQVVCCDIVQLADRAAAHADSLCGQSHAADDEPERRAIAERAGDARAAPPTTPVLDVPCFRVDAIVTDPPYGCMVLGKGELAYALADDREAGYRRQDDGERLSALEPLLKLAASVLEPGGRLCFLVPAPVGVARIEQMLPPTPSTLRIESALRMAFTVKQARWVVTMSRTPATVRTDSMTASVRPVWQSQCQ